MTVKRFVICFTYGMLGFFIVAIADAVFTKIFSGIEKTVGIQLLGILFGTCVMCVIYVLYADRFNAGRGVGADTVLSEGQTFRLIAASPHPANVGDEMGILIEVVPGDVRYVYVERAVEQFIPGYMYIYRGQKKIIQARVGRL